ncbi:MAG TPA: glycine zipper 2TM domain-containing protein [Allosphingosinicella sp.]|nr:glycine zipper 2TM domain-containing protein [Allosphingosinicella sp.]
MRRLVIAIAAAAIALPGAPAHAQYGGSPNDPQEDYPEAVELADTDRDYDTDYDPDYDDDRDYDRDSEDGDRGGTWRGDDGRTYCRRSDGTTGLIVGGAAGGLIGRGIDTRGERGTGTIIGAIAGALLGSAVERSARCR